VCGAIAADAGMSEDIERISPVTVCNMGHHDGAPAKS
jgi:hypothetical protein